VGDTVGDTVGEGSGDKGDAVGVSVGTGDTVGSGVAGVTGFVSVVAQAPIKVTAPTSIVKFNSDRIIKCTFKSSP
jgi:hypothetical protein